MSNNLLWWCGPCWVADRRVLAVKKLGKLPCCQAHIEELQDKPIELANAFAEWDAMPRFDERPSQQQHFDNFVTKLLSSPPKPMKA